jgi:N-acetylmuramoyl-L-alanine amidase
MPAILIETGFIDSDKDNYLFDYRFEDIVNAIALGIDETLRG